MRSKTHLIVIVLTFTLLMLACGLLQFGIEPATNTQNSTDPLPLLAQTELPISCYLSDYPVYLDSSNGFCFAYPAGFTIDSQNSEFPEVIGPPIGSALEPVFATFRVEFEPIQPEDSLRQQAETFLKDFSVVNPEMMNWEQVEISGEPGLMVEPIPAHLTWRIVFVRSEDKLFRLMFWPIDIPEAQTDLLSLYQMAARTFVFVDKE